MRTAGEDAAAVHMYRWSYDGDYGAMPYLLCSPSLGNDDAFDAIKARRARYRRRHVTCSRCLAERPSRVTSYDFASDPVIQREIEEHSRDGAR